MLDRLTEPDPASELKRLLRADGLIDNAATLVPLSGGVSSEIYLVRTDQTRFVVKRALRRLRVAEPWFADISRNRNEANYLRYAAALRPGNVPKLIHVSEANGYFCMEYLGDDWSNWKQSLLDGRCNPQIAAVVAEFLGTIHASSSADPEARARFDTLKAFEQLRIEPYLLAVAQRHESVRVAIEAEAERLRSQREVLVHGDFSPKNILIGPEGFVVVDCEVAWFGDAAFDIAFLLNHLLLKSLLHPSQRDIFRAMVDAAWSSYLATRFSIPENGAKAGLERNTGRLLLMLMLARIDGKSPVEYLLEEQRRFVREFALKGLAAAPQTVNCVYDEWFGALRSLRDREVGGLAG